MCVITHGITSDFELFEELQDLHSIADQTKISDFIQALLCSFQKHNLELSSFVVIVTDGITSMIGTKNGMVSLHYIRVQELGLQNELVQYHCVIHQQDLRN
jgi:hypothetical protein